MTDTQTTLTGHKAADKGPETHDLHEYAGGYIKAHEGVHSDLVVVRVFRPVQLGLLLHS